MKLVENSDELKFLVGFFYFSGLDELYQALKNNEDILIKILVGLNADKKLEQIYEFASVTKGKTDREHVEELYFNSLRTSLNSNDFDNKGNYEQILFFLNMIKQGKIIIRKTRNPNHGKLYYFNHKENPYSKSSFITGSSNLTSSGLHKQEEFNIEITDYYQEEVSNYFDELWEESVRITENPEFLEKLIKIIEYETLVTEVTPFEAFVKIMKTYLDTIQDGADENWISELLIKNNYKSLQYQIDAVKQAVNIIDNYGGCILADVVGLGKSVVASLIGVSLKERGMVICPPGLMGDDDGTSGWQKYLEDFDLHNWKVRSSGKLEEISEYLKERDDYDVIVIDEAHRFRNQDTQSYEYLQSICNGRKVILLTATPFNNSPSDVFSLLKLFIIPGKSSISLEDDIENKFITKQTEYEELSYILKNEKALHSGKKKDKKRKEKVIKNYFRYFGTKEIDISRVRSRLHEIAIYIRNTIEPITIRRNRLDLIKDNVYKDELNELVIPEDPQEIFFQLSKEQSKFYDYIIEECFQEEGKFTGAIYKPIVYEKALSEDNIEKLSQEDAFELYRQKNLYDFMRRLVVKRFESSFYAFAQTINNFIKINESALNFIENSKNKFILDRKLMNKYSESNEDEISEMLLEYEEELKKEEKEERYKVYDISSFEWKEQFENDIKQDLELFNSIKNKLEDLELVENDPKSIALINDINNIRDNDAEQSRKIIIFTEYVDTAKFLEKVFLEKFGSEVYAVTDKFNKTIINTINKNFDASAKKQANDYQILITTDKLSEGYNLNRAGAIVNYDIPWNPTRVIQRVGRINRINKKVFEKLYIYNIFPTERGEDEVRSREIAQNKMFLIHSILGEDSKIFDAGEDPKPSELYRRITDNPDKIEEENFFTIIRNKYKEVELEDPEVIKKIDTLPSRIKVAIESANYQQIIFILKNLGFFIKGIGDKGIVTEYSIEDVWEFINVDKFTHKKQLSSIFWDNYDKIKTTSADQSKRKYNPKSNEGKAFNNLKTMYSNIEHFRSYEPIIRDLLEIIAEYKTLSSFTLRKLASLELKEITIESVNNAKKVLDEIIKIMGEDYKSHIKRKLKDNNQDIIIAVEGHDE